MRYVGWFVTVLWLFGMLNIIDFHTCIKGAGECGCVKEYT